MLNRYTGCLPGSFVFFKIGAYTNVGVGYLSPGRRFVCAPLPEKPDAPFRLGSNLTSVTVGFSAGALYEAVQEGFAVYVDDGLSGDYSKHRVYNNSQTNFTAANLTASLGYRIRVSVISDVGESALSDPVVLYPGDVCPAPKAPIYVNSTQSTITVSWAPPASSGGNEVSGYRLEAGWYETLFQNVSTPDGGGNATYSYVADTYGYGTAWGNATVFLLDKATFVQTLDCTDIGGANLTMDYVFIRVAAITNVLLGQFSSVTRILCNWRPEAPTVYEPTGAGSTSTASGALVGWTENELYGARVLGYKVHANDGKGSDLRHVADITDTTQRTFHYTAANAPVSAFPNLGVNESLIAADRPYKFRVSVLTEVAESELSAEINIWSCSGPSVTESLPTVTRGYENETDSTFEVDLVWPNLQRVV